MFLPPMFPICPARAVPATRAFAARTARLACAPVLALALVAAAAPAAVAAASAERPAAKKPRAEPASRPAARVPARPAPRREAAPRAAAAAPLALPPAPGEQLAAAALAHFGEHACEFNQTLQVSLNLDHAGYLDVLFGNQFYVMKPVLSSTGALRLEDIGGRMLVLQIAFKSMLMDTRTGKRVADECVHEAHRVARRDAEQAPPRPGLGIAPAPAAAASAAPRGS